MTFKLNFNDVTIVKLTDEHKGVIESFSCGNEDEDLFLKNDALGNQNIGLSQTFLLFEEKNSAPVAYITLSIGSFKLDKDEAIEGIQIREKQYHIYSNNMPCLFIGKLATDKNESGRGAASHLVNFAVSRAVEISKHIPVPFIALDAYSDKVDFYKKLNFRIAFTPQKDSSTITMYVYIKPSVV